MVKATKSHEIYQYKVIIMTDYLLFYIPASAMQESFTYLFY